MSVEPNIYDLDGFRYAFQEIEGWTQWLYYWRCLRTAKNEDRCVWIENGTYEKFMRLIEYLNATSRNFTFETLTPEAA